MSRKATTTSASASRNVHHVRQWFASLIAGAALSVGLVSPAGATGGPPIGPVYDCYGFAVYAQITYFGAFQLKSSTTYLTAPTRKGVSLSGPVRKGTYKLRGTKLIFLTGTYGKLHWYGVWKATRANGDARHIGLFTPKGQEPLECYPWPH